MIRFSGAFADGRVGGVITLFVAGDGRRITDVMAYAPGPCNDRDFGQLTPGDNGASGIVFSFNPNGGAAIRSDGSFSISGIARERFGSTGYGKPIMTATIAVTGMFTGDQLRGRVKGRSKLPYATCTADVAFTAQRSLG